MNSTPEPHLVVIFGGTGDLAGRKLLPALHRLFIDGHVTGERRILGVGRRGGRSDDEYRRWARSQLSGGGFSETELARWADDCLSYQSIGDGTVADYRALRERIEEIEGDAGLPGNRAFYLALPAAAFGPTVTSLGAAGLATGPGFTRVVIEKPFGHDLVSGCRLNETLHAVLDEEQIYRIDHYLGKETVQNLLVFRFGNAIFESLWNRDRVESVAITVAESLGVEDRAAFYEKTGAIRDIVQNHLIQVLCLVAMEVPPDYEATLIRNEKIKLLRAIEAIRPGDAVFGRYGAGADGPAYLDTAGVPADSRTETYFAARLRIDNWRWQGVPFYIRTGKRLERKLTEIAVRFRRPPVCLFESLGSCMLHSNVLRITLQPDEGFSLEIDVKRPGSPLAVEHVPLDFCYGERFGPLPDAYQTLLLDVLDGDQTLFVHADEVEASWRLFGPVIAGDREVHEYAPGSWGPKAADELLGRNGHHWTA